MKTTSDRKKDRHRAGATVLLRMSAHDKAQITAAVDLATETLPAHARTSTGAWILAVALEAARRVTGVSP